MKPRDELNSPDAPGSPGTTSKASSVHFTPEHLAVDEFVVASHADYLKVVGQLYGDYTEDGSVLFFRGQTSEYRLPDGRLALVPSYFRSPSAASPPAASDENGFDKAVCRYLERHLKTADELTRRTFENEFGSRFETFYREYEAPIPAAGFFHPSDLTELPAIYETYLTPEFRAAVSQHYGLPTGMLDVTTDPAVALWFATHRYTRRGGVRLVDYELASGEGYVYALQVVSEPGQVTPLSMFCFDGATRPRTQRAAMLSRYYRLIPDDMLERARKSIPPWALATSSAKNTFADRVVARIVAAKPFPSPAIDRPSALLFPGPHEDVLYALLLKHCTWTEVFAHCNDARKRRRRDLIAATDRNRPIESRRELAGDASWFTVLFVGEDANATLAYAWRNMNAANLFGRMNLFDRVGVNLFAASANEAPELSMAPGVSAILFCDIDHRLLQDGTVETLCRFIATSQRVVVPAYSNLPESDRMMFSEQFNLLASDTSQSEAWKITRSLRTAIELSWQLQRACAESACRQRFTKSLFEYSAVAKQNFLGRRIIPT